MSLKLTKEEILKEFGDYSPPTWMIEVIQKIGKKYGEKVIDKCAEVAEIDRAWEPCDDEVDKDSILILKEEL